MKFDSLQSEEQIALVSALPPYTKDMSENQASKVPFNIFGIPTPVSLWAIYCSVMTALDFVDLITDTNVASTMSFEGAAQPMIEKPFKGHSQQPLGSKRPQQLSALYIILLWSGVGGQLLVSYLTSSCCGQGRVVIYEHVLKRTLWLPFREYNLLTPSPD